MRGSTSRVLRAYVAYFNHARPHQGLGQQIPEPKAALGPLHAKGGRVICSPILGGLHHSYQRVAWLFAHTFKRCGQGRLQASLLFALIIHSFEHLERNSCLSFVDAGNERKSFCFNGAASSCALAEVENLSP